MNFTGLFLTNLTTQANSTAQLERFSRRPPQHGPGITGALSKTKGIPEAQQFDFEIES